MTVEEEVFERQRLHELKLKKQLEETQKTLDAGTKAKSDNHESQRKHATDRCANNIMPSICFSIGRREFVNIITVFLQIHNKT
jgi:hypothetical protein